ncbi:MAG: histone deacetylase [Rhizobiaceae bacterium]|nr:histone deacetylase [Rhizobiaceae bacterium]
MALPIVHHPDYDAKFAVNHRFPMGKYSALMRSLRARGLAHDGTLVESAPAPAAWLRLAHDATYVDQVLRCAVPKSVEREIGFAIGERVSLRARLAAAGTAIAADIALANGIACNAAGGSHHARRAHGAGFCTFNDVGVAASMLLAAGRVSSILVVDLDVHQGDGTAEIFAEEPRVFTFSLHAERNYPVRKVPSRYDFALPDAVRDAAYLECLDDALERMAAVLTPDIVFYNAGVDPHEQDRLGRLSLSNDGIRARDRRVIAHFRSRGIPLVGVVGGGYADDVSELAERHAIMFETAASYA